MASINGISIKSLKMFYGHEGEPCYQGNVYLDGKKLGFWSQDSHGGPDEYDFPMNEFMQRSSEFLKTLPDYKEFYDEDITMYELTKLMDDEKTYKKFQKKGFSYMLVISDGAKVSYTAMNRPFTEADIAENVSEFKPYIKDATITHRVVNSLDDFIIKTM